MRGRACVYRRKSVRVQSDTILRYASDSWVQRSKSDLIIRAYNYGPAC
jgi:hypothetical protein